MSLACDALAIHVEELLVASPFELTRPYGVVSVYDATLEVMKSSKIQISLLRASFKYLFTMAANLLMDLLTEHESYQDLAWSVGVRLRGNLDKIYNWAEKYGLAQDFRKVNLKLSEAADLASDSKNYRVQKSKVSKSSFM